MPVDVRDSIQAEVFDYQTLIDALKGLAYPRNRINDLLRQGVVLRVKKGLYVFGDRYRRHPYSKELLANLVYGPSYVSLDYALAYHGLIPERVEAMTSVTPEPLAPVLHPRRPFRLPADPGARLRGGGGPGGGGASTGVPRLLSCKKSHCRRKPACW